MRVVLGSDEEGHLVESLCRHVGELGHEVSRVAVGAPWTQVGRAVGEEVAAGRAEVGIVCCWTGTGVSIAANKVPSVRAALCGDAETAAGARRWNDANVLAMSIRLTTPALAEEIVGAFLATSLDEAERVLVATLEAGGDDRSSGRVTDLPGDDPLPWPIAP